MLYCFFFSFLFLLDVVFINLFFFSLLTLDVLDAHVCARLKD